MANQQESSPMVGGEGPHSYARNSGYQKGLVDLTKEMMNQCIADKLDFKNLCNFDTPKTFRIADFGCSSGPNTFFVVQNIIEAIARKYQAQLQNPSPLEFHVFFSDLTNNDFNTLFKTLPSFQTNYFAAGVPGSFYNRLLPESTLHFVHSSYALHWLSAIPKQIVIRESPAWNKGSIMCNGLLKEVAEAYSVQFESDVNAFLNARAKEIVGGGLMAIVVGGLPDGVVMSQTSTGTLYDLLGSCLVDMAKQGELSEEKVDSFNLPLYYSTANELEEIIKKNGYFNIERIESLKSHPMLQMKVKENTEFITLQMRAVLEEILKQHFGDEQVTSKIFQRFAGKLQENCSIFDGLPNHINLFVLLKRNH